MNEHQLSEAKRALREAIEKSGPDGADGTQETLASAIAVSQQTVSRWLRTGFISRAEKCTEIQRITGVDRMRMRPDAFAPVGEPIGQAA